MVFLGMQNWLKLKHNSLLIYKLLHFTLSIYAVFTLHKLHLKKTLLVVFYRVIAALNCGFLQINL